METYMLFGRWMNGKWMNLGETATLEQAIEEKKALEKEGCREIGVWRRVKVKND